LIGKPVYYISDIHLSCPCDLMVNFRVMFRGKDIVRTKLTDRNVAP